MKKILYAVLGKTLPKREWRRAMRAKHKKLEIVKSGTVAAPDIDGIVADGTSAPVARASGGFVVEPYGMKIEASIYPPPPSSPPGELVQQYSMNGKIPIHYFYQNDAPQGRQDRLRITRNNYEDVFSQFEKKTFIYYGDSMPFFYEAAEKYPLSGKTVIIYGLASVNCEAFAVWKNAGRVVVVDYNLPICEHERIEVISHAELARSDLRADVAISFSSFEHDGLGRYGDPLSPDGDLAAMQTAREHLRPGGLLYLGVPLGKDAVVWNIHRVYGRQRLPLLLLLKGWDCLAVYGNFVMPSDEPIFDIDGDTGYFHPLLVLENKDEDVIDYAEYDRRISSAVHKHDSPTPSRKTENTTLLAQVLQAKKANWEVDTSAMIRLNASETNNNQRN